jgi:hypothetical protein
MQGIERAYCDACLKALVRAARALMETSAAEALRAMKNYGKGDTLGLDAIPEIIINERLADFDRHAILVTEELDAVAKGRWPTDSDPLRQPLMFFSDPTDRSKYLKRFIEKISEGDPLAKVGDLMEKQSSCIKLWEELFDGPAQVTGATTSITCIRKGEIVFTAILNYITRGICVASSQGVFHQYLPPFSGEWTNTASMLPILVDRLEFLPATASCEKPEDYKRFVTFLGKSGYRENFNDSMIFVENPDGFLHHREPGGPSRVLYLSELQKGHGPVGFVLANGEKIAEWMPWLAFVKFARNSEGERMLRAFEISIDRPWTKEGVLMSSSPPYSIFCDEGSRSYLDISRLKNFEHPSRFRSMLVVTPYDNERIIYTMRQHGYRDISESF